VPQTTDPPRCTQKALALAGWFGRQPRAPHLIGRTLILTINPMKGYQAIINRFEAGGSWVLEQKWQNNYSLDELLKEVLLSLKAKT